VVSETPSPSTRTVTDKVFCGVQGAFFSKAALSRLSARSVLLPTEAGRGRHRRPAPLGERKNLLAGCIFVGEADKSAFALLSQKVTKARRKRRKNKTGKEVILRREQ